MFRAQRNGKSPSSGERIDFKFSNFQALQVPKVWDKLLVSIISVETGKTIARSSKALVRNGTCQWTETLSESIWISHYDSSKELEEHLFKFVVSMGSARSGILGEATVNIARYYTSSRSSAPVSLPLKKCNYGTVLQVSVMFLECIIYYNDFV
ncbi:putative NT-type C2 domain-containing protein [Tanacetum coccineum]